MATIPGLGRFFGTLPTELILDIGDFLDFNTICTLRATSLELAISSQGYVEKSLENGKQVSTTREAMVNLSNIPSTCPSYELPSLVKVLNLELAACGRLLDVYHLKRQIGDALSKLPNLEVVNVHLGDSVAFQRLEAKQMDKMVRTLVEVFSALTSCAQHVHFKLDVGAPGELSSLVSFHLFPCSLGFPWHGRRPFISASTYQTTDLALG